MKTFDNLVAMRACLPEGACEPTAQAVADMEDYFDGPVEQASFTDLFGEPLYLVEQVEDLGRVMTVEVEGGAVCRLRRRHPGRSIWPRGSTRAGSPVS